MAAVAAVAAVSGTLGHWGVAKASGESVAASYNTGDHHYYSESRHMQQAGVSTHDHPSLPRAAPQPWPPVFPESGPATLYMGLVHLNELNKHNKPTDKLMYFYHKKVFPLHFQMVDADLKYWQNFDVSVTNIKGAWPKYIKCHVLNTTQVAGRVASKNIEYQLYVEYGTNNITVAKAIFVRNPWIAFGHQVPPAARAPPAPRAPPAARVPPAPSAYRMEEDLLALSYTVGSEGPREEEG